LHKYNISKRILKICFIQKVPIDISTPDNALKSYWAVRDSISAQQFGARNLYEDSDRNKRAESQMASVSEQPISKIFTEDTRVLDSYSREIVEVKIESESRAVIIVVVKNTTPVPEGAVPTQDEAKSRSDGDRYRYVMGHDKSGWRVSEVLSWQSYFSKWTKLYPHSDKPSVPYMTHWGY
jgi:hypothetical protein